MSKKSKKRESNKMEIREEEKRPKKEKKMELKEEKGTTDEQSVHSDFDKELEQSRYAICIELLFLENPPLRVLNPKSNIIVKGQTSDLSVPVSDDCRHSQSRWIHCFLKVFLKDASSIILKIIIEVELQRMKPV